MRSVRCTVSREFRDLLKDTFPELCKNPSYWRFLGYCLFGTHVDKDDYKLLISKEVLATIEQKSHLLKHENYKGEVFLEAYQRDVAPIRWTSWDKNNGKARKLIDTGLPAHILEAAAVERSTHPAK